VVRFPLPPSISQFVVRVLTVLKKWTKVYWNDYISDEAGIKVTMTFLEEVAATHDKFGAVAASILTQIKNNNEDVRLKALHSEKYVPLISPKSVPRNDLTSIFNLFTIDEIALQISLIDWQIFARLEPNEFQDSNWTKTKQLFKSRHSTLSFPFLPFCFIFDCEFFLIIMFVI
jgi:hypothetical protein